MTTQETKDYYKKKYHFDDVDFKTPYDFDNYEAGQIIVTRNGITKTIGITDLLATQGFDGIDDVMQFADEHFNVLSD